MDRNGCLILIGMIIGLGVLLSMCSRESGVSSAQKERYDKCVAEKQKLGVGIIKADEICDYWKRANP